MMSLFFVIAAGFALIVYANWWTAKRRRETFRALATARNWTYVPADDSLPEQWPGSPFGIGRHPRARNVVSGVHDGRPFVAFDYSYKTTSSGSNGSSTSTEQYSICALAREGSLPGLEVTRQSWFGRFATALGMQDHQVADPEFNRRYRVRAQTPEFAAAVLQPTTTATLLAADFGAWRITGDAILSWEKGKHRPEELDARFAVLDAVLDGIPPTGRAGSRGPEPAK
jgi:hypothetical protein